MNQFKNILIVMNNHREDETYTALEKGIQLAKKNSARVMLFNVVETPGHLTGDFESVFGGNDLTGILVTKETHKLYELYGKYKSQGVNIEYEVVAGKNLFEILRQMLIGEHDLLIKTAEEALETFSSSDFHLMRKCPAPVWLIKPDHVPNRQKVMAAIDLSMENSNDGRSANKLILGLASSLARQENAEFVVFSCWSLHDEHAMRHSNFINISADEIDHLANTEQSLNKQKLDEITLPFTDMPIKKVLMKGNPKYEIPKFVKDEAISSTVMGTAARTGIQDLLIGSTSETILRYLESSVITIKPPGFKGLIAQ